MVYNLFYFGKRYDMDLKFKIRAKLNLKVITRNMHWPFGHSQAADFFSSSFSNLEIDKISVHTIIDFFISKINKI